MRHLFTEKVWHSYLVSQLLAGGCETAVSSFGRKYEVVVCLQAAAVCRLAVLAEGMCC